MAAKDGGFEFKDDKMTRETKVSLLVGFCIILLIAILVSTGRAKRDD